MTVTPYRQAQDHAKATLRRAVVDAAVGILERDGPAALSVRAVAAEVGSSTKVIYTTFGDKAGLASALFSEGFDRLTAALAAAAAAPDPRARILDLARAYLDFSRAHPTFFAVMYGAPMREFFPTKESREVASGSFEVLLAAVRRAQDAGALRAGDPVAQGRLLWSAMHGPTQLAAHGWLEADEAGRHLDDAVCAVLDALAASPPAPPPAAR